MISTMSSIQGVVFAVAMAAVSGAAAILLILKLHKSPSPSPELQTDNAPLRPPRPCISSGDRKGERKKKKVSFAKDVVEPSANNEEFRRRNRTEIAASTARKAVKGGMPANRVALYNGILRDRVVHRMGYSY